MRLIAPASWAQATTRTRDANAVSKVGSVSLSFRPTNTNQPASLAPCPLRPSRPAMWSKISNAMGKSRTDDSQGHSQVHRHPNTSSRSLVSNSDASSHRGEDDTARTSGTPPSSPSKAKKLLRRMSRTTMQAPKFDHDEEESDRNSSFKFPISLPKRVKSHLHLNGNSALHCHFIHHIAAHTPAPQAPKAPSRAPRPTLLPLAPPTIPFDP